MRDGPAGDLGDRTLHLSGCDVGARRLDHRIASPDEVHETVGVGANEIAGVKPAVGVEALLAAALVVPLHHMRPADAQLAVDDFGFEARHRPAERTAPVLGLIGLVLADGDDAARFGHAEHGVPQLGIGRPDIGRHDRVQVATAHRGQIAPREAGVTGKVGDACHETVRHGRLLGLEQIQRLAGIDGVGAHQGRTGEQGGQHRERDSADPEERRIAEQFVLRGQPADLVQDPLVLQKRCVRVNHALGSARRPRRVHDGHWIRFLDVVFHCLEQRGVDRLVGFVVDQDVAQQRGSVLAVGEACPVVVRSEGGSGQQDFGVAVGQLYRELRGSGEGRKRYDDSADACRG